MRSALDALWMALSAIRARRVRFSLLAVGPFLGTAVIVASFGILESAQGELRLMLRDLGRDLVVVSAPEGARISPAARQRLAGVSTVVASAGISVVDGAVGYATHPGQAPRVVAPSIYAGDLGLIAALDVPLVWGRDLDPLDETYGTNAALIGRELADLLMLDTAQEAVVFVNERPFGVIGVLGASPLAPELDRAVVISRTSAAELDMGLRPPGLDRLYVRVDERRVAETAAVLARAITLGEGIQPRITVPAQLLQAQVAIDRTLAGVVLGLGGLVMAAGAFGIANVMTISVVERRMEIGVRRALGHPRGAVAAQFLTEGAVVGVLGSLAGVLMATMVVLVVADQRGWTYVPNPGLALGALGAGVIITIMASAYPATRAARLEPLAALRGN